MTVTPTQLDGGTFVILGVLAAAIAAFNSDDAAKFIAPYILFLIKLALNCTNAGFLALKMFRSTTYAHMVDEKKKNGTAPPFKPEPRAP